MWIIVATLPTSFSLAIKSLARSFNNTETKIPGSDLFAFALCGSQPWNGLLGLWCIVIPCWVGESSRIRGVIIPIAWKRTFMSRDVLFALIGSHHLSMEMLNFYQSKNMQSWLDFSRWVSTIPTQVSMVPAQTEGEHRGSQDAGVPWLK